MRFVRICLLCLLCSSVALAQTRAVLQLKANFGFTGQHERIGWDKYLERENQLLLMSDNNLQLIDVGNAKVLEERPSPVSTLIVRGRYSFDDLVISPDGRKMLLVGYEEAKEGAQKNALICDLQTGKRIAVLDKSPTRIRAGKWSQNGQTLVTFDRDIIFRAPSKVTVSFWDGETFEYRHSINVDYPTWTYLSDDGKRFFAASGREKSFFGLKYVSDSRGIINVWDTRSGQLEKTISVSDRNFNPRTMKISVSPDEKFLVFVNKHKSKAAEHRLLAWEMNGGIYPKYEFKANPKIDNSYVSFSPDAKYFALDAGKTLQIYETQTGEKRYELQDIDLPDLWLNDNKTLLHYDFKKLNAFEITNGQQLYEQRLIFKSVDVPTGSGTTDENGNVTYSTETIVVDRTNIVAHPNGKIFLTYSNQYVEIFDARTGVLLQTVISPDLAAPEIGFCQKYPKQCKGALVWKAGWSADGKTLYVFNANRQTISLWALLEN